MQKRLVVVGAGIAAVALVLGGSLLISQPLDEEASGISGDVPLAEPPTAKASRGEAREKLEGELASAPRGAREGLEELGYVGEPTLLPVMPQARTAKRQSRAPLEAARPAPASGEEHLDPGVNGWTAASGDRLSTFSIDVDTGAYTFARRKLQGGALPTPAGVRVEEFINYFPYDYAAPADGAPFAAHLEATPHPLREGYHLLRVGIKGAEPPARSRKPARLTFLVDVSGSMSSEDRLPLAVASLRELVRGLGDEDSVAIATYAGRTERVLPPTPATRRDAIDAALERLTSGGGTAMDSGIELAYSMASAAFVPGAENRVIILSDGDANVGPSSRGDLLRTIADFAGKGITLTTVGFGEGNYKDATMEQLADKGDGSYYYIDSLSEARRVFGVHLAGTLSVIARDVKIQVEFDPAVVQSYRLLGYENRAIADRDFRNDEVDAGEIGAGHAVTALYELRLAPRASRADLATIRLRARPPGPDAPAAEWLTTLPRASVRSSFSAAGADTRLAFAAAAFAEKLRQSEHFAEVTWDQVAALARAAQRGHAEDGELVELVAAAAALAGQRERGEASARLIPVGAGAR